MQHEFRKKSRIIAIVAAFAVIATLIAACTGGSPQPTQGGDVAQKGGTATFAWLPNSAPNYILPFTDSNHYSVFNLFEFQQLMYRPLYVTGVSGEAKVDSDLSMANPPTVGADGKSVTVKLRDYAWSDGTKVTSKDISFFHNMAVAEKSLWGPYSGGAYPDNVTSLEVNSADEVTFHLDSAYGKDWFWNNQLTLITPMPPAWDKTSDAAAAGSGGCATDVAKCAQVYNYLNGKAKDMSGYVSDPLWKVVDGPWTLKSFNADGNISFVPNKKYSGTDKPKLDGVTMLPYTSEIAEYNALQSGSGPDVGYVPASSAQSKSSGNPLGALSSNYQFDPWYWWGLDYTALNFNNPTVGPMFKQLYVRQALQHIVDQPTIIKGALKGFGSPINGPVPSTPDSDLYLSKFVKSTPYPFSVKDSSNLLKANGWKVIPDGTSTCESPGTGSGECGADIAAGTKLEFTLEYADIGVNYDQSMNLMRSNASQAGITITLRKAPFSTVLGDATRCKKDAAPSSCTWQMAGWGGRSFRPYPTGEALFASTGGANRGGYNDPKADQLIAATFRGGASDALQQYQDYLAKQIPLIWQPMPTEQLTVINKKLRGVTPQNPLLGISPENWYFVK